MTDDDRARALLLGALAAQRAHVLRAVEALTEAQLRAAPLPSGWSIAGLVRHLVLGGERYWFHVVVAGEPLDFWPDDVPALDAGRPADWRLAPEEDARAVVDEYRAAIARSDAILAATSLDAPPAAPEPDWPAGRFADVRAIVHHVLQDAAVHSGHLDAALELLDGRQRLVL